MPENGAFLLLAKGLTALADADFLLVFFSLGYWLIDRRVFTRVFVLVTTTVLVSSILKAWFRVARPAGEHLVQVEGWSFPSGHAMVAAAIWPALAFYLVRFLRQRARRERPPSEAPATLVAAIFVGTALLVVGIAASRVVLGVHTVRDIAWGGVAGLLMAALGIYLGERPLRPWKRMGADGRAVVIAAAVGLVLSLLPRNGDLTAATAGGGLVGFWIGAALARMRYARYVVRGLPRMLAAAALGLAGAFALRVGLKVLLAYLGQVDLLQSSAESAQAVRYVVVGLWVALLAPRLFVWLGLSRPDWLDEGGASAARSRTG